MVRIPMAVNDSIAATKTPSSEGLIVDSEAKNRRPMVLIAPNMRAANPKTVGR
jgi:hypothetical protein